ncbi:MAG: hypothetical protein GY898_31155 [Proteobacteria bacterium]|nr:hypothetical protein [Pseudomonadota bacterium]
MLRLAAFLSAAVLLAASAPSAKLVQRAGDTSPSGKFLMQVEVDWEGRPEEYLLGAPTVDAPKGGAVRMGRTASSFDGTRTHWTADVVVELPDKGTEWNVGPARIPIKAGPHAGQDLTAAPLKVGSPNTKRQALIAQGIGNGVVVFLVLAYVTFRWRGLTRLEEAPA